MDVFLQPRCWHGRRWRSCRVSILVLVDVFLQPYHCQRQHRTGDYVSILVLVDVFLQPGRWSCRERGIESFNPCFSGCLSSTAEADSAGGIQNGFNPCFSGCLSSTIRATNEALWWHVVSILVLVDVFLQHCGREWPRHRCQCFNPCFSGCLSSTDSKEITVKELTVFQSLF